MKAKVNERCCVIGTLFKKMELKPSILKEISDNVRHHSPSTTNFHSLPLSLSPFLIPASKFTLPTLSEELTLSPHELSLSPPPPSSPTPSLLLPLLLQHHLLPQPPRAKSISTSDTLVVEDSTQRVALCGNIPSTELVTGTPDTWSHSISMSIYTLQHIHVHITLMCAQCADTCT